MIPIVRTTLGEYLSHEQEPIKGIYIIACYPLLGVLYIGISNNIYKRLREHLSGDNELSNFVRQIFADACGFRLDIFEIEDREKQIYYETKLIEYFQPIFNKQNK